MHQVVISQLREGDKDEVIRQNDSQEIIIVSSNDSSLTSTNFLDPFGILEKTAKECEDRLGVTVTIGTE